MSKRKEESNGAKSIKILTGIVIFLQNETILRCGKKKKRRWMKEGCKNIISIRKNAKKVNWRGGIYKGGRLSLKLFTNNMDSEFYVNILDEKCLEINYQERIK